MLDVTASTVLLEDDDVIVGATSSRFTTVSTTSRRLERSASSVATTVNVNINEARRQKFTFEIYELCVWCFLIIASCIYDFSVADYYTT